MTVRKLLLSLKWHLTHNCDNCEYADAVGNGSPCRYCLFKSQYKERTDYTATFNKWNRRAE